MMKASRGNRLSSGWRCPHCGTDVDARTFVSLHPTRTACSARTATVHAPSNGNGRPRASSDPNNAPTMF